MIALAGAAALAQDRGTIRGTVTDQSGAAVAGAEVTARNVDTGLRQPTTSGADGIFNLLYLPAGNYTVTVAMTGFRSVERTGIRVNVATVAGLDVTLAVGTVDQSVDVTAAPPLLELQGTNLGKVLPTRAIRDLPLFIGGGVRSNLAFVILTPGVIGPANNPRIGVACSTGRASNSMGPKRRVNAATTRL